MKLRTLNDAGLKMFRDYLDKLRGDPTNPVPFNLLTDSESSDPLEAEAEISDRELATKREAVKYLSEVLSNISFSDLASNVGLWSWLALFYFDQICPPDSSGRRHPRENARYILDPHPYRMYRHQLYGPFRIFYFHRDSAKCFLHGSITTVGDFIGQVASRIERISNRALVEALDRLYFDEGKDRLKTGATNRKKPGTLRRFLTVMDQFDVTYDLFSISTERLLEILPDEFSAWQT